MADKLYVSETPDEVKNAKGLHLLTMSTPNGQAVQIFLEELAEVKCADPLFIGFLRLNPNGRIPVLVDNNQSPPFTVHETSAELLYLLKEADKEDKFGFKDELERNEALQ
ncbi:glutathione s-transferase II [Seiridium cupressi]